MQPVINAFSRAGKTTDRMIATRHSDGRRPAPAAADSRFIGFSQDDIFCENAVISGLSSPYFFYYTDALLAKETLYETHYQVPEM